MTKLLCLVFFLAMGCNHTSYYDCSKLGIDGKDKVIKAMERCNSQVRFDAWDRNNCIERVRSGYCELVIVETSGCSHNIMYGPNKKKKNSGRTSRKE